MKRIITRVSDDTAKYFKVEKLEGLQELNLQGLGKKIIDLSKLQKSEHFQNAYAYDSITEIPNFNQYDDKVTGFTNEQIKPYLSGKPFKKSGDPRDGQILERIEFKYNGVQAFAVFKENRWYAYQVLSLLLYYGD